MILVFYIMQNLRHNNANQIQNNELEFLSLSIIFDFQSKKYFYFICYFKTCFFLVIIQCGIEIPLFADNLANFDRNVFIQKMSKIYFNLLLMPFEQQFIVSNGILLIINFQFEFHHFFTIIELETKFYQCDFYLHYSAYYFFHFLYQIYSYCCYNNHCLFLILHYDL